MDILFFKRDDPTEQNLIPFFIKNRICHIILVGRAWIFIWHLL